MTLDKLALMIGKGFNGVDKRFAEINATMNEKFEAVDKRFDRVDAKFEQVTKQINNISLSIVDVVHQEEFDKLESRVITVEEKVGLAPKKS